MGRQEGDAPHGKKSRRRLGLPRGKYNMEKEHMGGVFVNVLYR